MSHRKQKPIADIKPWLSAEKNCVEGRFIQVGNSLMLSKPIQVLTANARWLMICMAMESGRSRRFVFTHSTAEKYGLSASTFDEAKKQLLQIGYIKIVNNEDYNQYKANEFEFISDWKDLSVDDVEGITGKKHNQKKKRKAPNF